MLEYPAAVIMSRLPQVDIDPGKVIDKGKKNLPDSDGIVNKGNDAGDWLAGRGASFWTIIAVLIMTGIIWKLIKNPVVKGSIIGAIVISILIYSVSK